MHRSLLRLACLVAGLALATTTLAQTGHPLKGSWSGDWGPNPDHRNRVLVLFDWDGQEITGIINPGPNAIQMTSATLDPSDWSVRFEAEVPIVYRNNELSTYVMEGTISNLGSWTNRVIRGTWTHDDMSGDFEINLN